MRHLLLVLLVFVLLFTPVIGEVSFSCQQDIDCQLYLNKEVECVDSICQVVDVEDKDRGVIDYFKVKENVEVNFLEIRSIDVFVGLEICDKEGCISFSPVVDKPILLEFLDWLFYV